MADSGSDRLGDGRVSRCGPEPKHNPLFDGAVPGNSRLRLGSDRGKDVLESDVTSEEGVTRQDTIPPPSSFRGQVAMAQYRVHESASFRYALAMEGVDTDKLKEKVGASLTHALLSPQHPREGLWKRERGWGINAASNREPESTPPSVIELFKGGQEPSEVGSQLRL